jgi:hypothetical protein
VAQQAAGRRERRSHAQQRRDYVVTGRLSLDERAALAAAADRAGMALAAWICDVGMDAAEARSPGPAPALQREMLTELIRAADLVRRVGVNFNQAVTRLNAAGVPGPDLQPSAAYCMRVVRRIDDTADLIARRLRTARRQR